MAIKKPWLTQPAYGYETNLWTLTLLADINFQTGLTAHRVHADKIHQALPDMGINWSRAKPWLYSPDELPASVTHEVFAISGDKKKPDLHPVSSRSPDPRLSGLEGGLGPYSSHDPRIG